MQVSKGWFRKSILLGLVMVLMISLATPSLAAGGVAPIPIPGGDASISIKDFSLSVWPEYDKPEKGWPTDRPAVLVQYQGTLYNNTGKDFNQKLTFNVPQAKEFQVSMVCETENGMACQPYDLKDGKVSWQPSRTLKPGDKFPFMVEFYYNPIVGDKDKSFTYNFLPSYNIESLSVSVKAPLKATNFKIDPEAAQKNKDSEGFDTFLYQYSNLSPADTDKVKYNISYTKADNNPSKQPPSAQGQKDQNANSNEVIGTNSWTKPSVIIPSILIILLMVAFIIYAVKNNSNNNGRSKNNRAQRINNKTGNGNQKSGKSKNNPTVSKEKKKLRQMLLNGDISEDTYRELVDEIEDE